MPAKRATSPAQLAVRVEQEQHIGVDGMNAVVERPRRLLLSVEDALQVLGMARPRFYREVKSGRIEVLKDGKRTRVPYGALKAYVRMLCEEQGLSPEAYSLVG